MHDNDIELARLALALTRKREEHQTMPHRYLAIEHDDEWWLLDTATGREQGCDTEADARWFAGELNDHGEEGEPPDPTWSADACWDPEAVAREIQARRIATRRRLRAALGG